MDGLDHGFFRIYVFPRLLFVIDQEADGYIDCYTQRHAENQYRRGFERYANPAHNSAGDHQGNDIGQEWTKQDPPGTE